MLSIGLLSLLIAVPLASYQITPSQFNRLTVLTLISGAILTLNSFNFEVISEGVGIFSGYYEITAVSAAAEILLLSIGAILLCSWASNSPNFGKSMKGKNTSIPTISEYSLITLFFVVGATMLISSTNIVSMFVSLELQSFALYVTAGIYKDSETATSASLKYFFLGAFSSAIILLGTALVYASTGIMDFQSIFALIWDSNSENSLFGVNVGFILILLGFLFKVAAAPLHNWAPDVYDGTPTIVTLWLSTIPKISIFAFLLTIAFGVSNSTFIWSTLISVFAIISLVVGTILGISQTRIKRLLTYSTVSHVGFMLLALCCSTQESTESFVFYLIQYSVTNATILIVVLAIGYSMKHGQNGEIGDIENIKSFQGQFYQNPLLSVCIAICLFSIAGIPPIIGFFAKMQVLSATIHSGFFFLAFVAICTSVISAFYYLKIVKMLFFYKGNDTVISTQNASENTFKDTTNIHSTFITFFSLSLTLFLLNPSILLNIGKLLSLQYYTQLHLLFLSFLYPFWYSFF